MRITVLLILIASASCTSLRPLTDPTLTRENLSLQLNVDDPIWVLKKNGEDYRNFIIDGIEDTYVLGHNNEADVLIIPYTTIENIKVYQHSTVKTVCLVVGIPIGILILAVIDCGGCGSIPF